MDWHSYDERKVLALERIEVSLERIADFLDPEGAEQRQLQNEEPLYAEEIKEVSEYSGSD